MSKKATLGLLAQTLLAFGLLFLGWGFDDLGGFFAHPARTGLVGVALLSLALALVMRLDVQVFRKGKRPVGRQRFVLPAVMLTALVMIVFLAYGDRRSVLTFEGADLLRYVGLGLYAGGNVLAFLALHALGRHYSGFVTLQEEHKLVQTGIYGLIRHPIYLRALLVAVGFPLLFRSWLVFLFLALAIVFVAARIRQEEKMLAEEFGPEFEAYRRRAWRLVPYVY